LKSFLYLVIMVIERTTERCGQSLLYLNILYTNCSIPGQGKKEREERGEGRDYVCIT
jgi:hypothetical protein